MPALERATLNEAELKRLIKIYNDGQQRIIDTFGTATDFGQARRIEQLAQIDAILKEMGVQTGDWIDTVLGSQYERGTSDALKQLGALNVGIKESTTMSTIDRRAVAALASDAQLAFGTALTTVGKSADRILSDAVKAAITDELAQGRVLGSTRAEISRRIKANLKSDGITALVDRRGAQWSLDRYAEMLARTKMVEARNTGLANKMVANGYDLVEVSTHFSLHKECAHWEGRILSLIGATPGYPTLEQAKANGLFHPNCRHQINAIKNDYAALTTAYDPRSGTYKQPFEQNAPAMPTGTVKAVQGASQRPTSLTFKPARGKGATYQMNNVEAEVMDLGKINYGAQPQRGRWKTGNHGVYTESYNQYTGEVVARHLSVRYPGTEEGKHTFYHEIGHAIDANLSRIIDGVIDTPKVNDRRIIDIPAVKRALNADREAVLKERIARQYRDQLTPEQLADVQAGKRVEYTKTVNGRPATYILHIQGAWKKYALNDKEIFADMYAVWRIDPAYAAQIAPELTKIYEGVINGTIR